MRRDPAPDANLLVTTGSNTFRDSSSAIRRILLKPSPVQLLHAVSVAGMLVLPMLPEESRAQDASFGCKVFLCVLATAPSWSGIPYCVPLVKQALRDLARGRPWPVCSEGKASAPVFQPWDPCPAGLVPATQTGQSFIADENGSMCVSQRAIGLSEQCSDQNSSSL